MKNLDIAIDMHISMVQMRKHVAAGLAEGKDFRKVVQDAIQTEQKERKAVGAAKLCLRFHSCVQKAPTFSFRATATTYDLDAAIDDWIRVTGLKEPLRQVGKASIQTQCKEERAEKKAVGEQQRVSRLELLRQKLKNKRHTQRPSRE